MTPVVEIVTRAMDHHRQGRLPEAEAGYRDALRREPNNPDALHLLGVIIGQGGDPAQGIAMIERAVKLTPSSVEAHINLANLLTGLARFSDAEKHFRAAERLRPGNAETANGIGGCLLRIGRHEEAEVWLKKALTRDPRCVSALVNMGSLMEATGRRNETLAFYDRALAADPGYAEAHQYKSLALLARGHLIEGWREYEWRFKRAAGFKGRFAFPYWRGETLAGRKILVWTEQGLGDEILILGMVPDLLQAGARVVLICSPRLAGLAARSFPDIDIIPIGGQPAHAGVMAGVAYQTSMSDLGLQLRSSIETFPRREAYLQPDAALARTLKERYRGDTGHRLVGISWRSKAEDGGAEKTIPLEQWAPVLRVPGVTFVNLQYGDTQGDIANVGRELGVKIETDPDVSALGDMSPFASQVAALDLTITVSNTTAHVAGAVGARAWTLIPANSGRLWYWFLERADSPWYPSLRLFRQRGPKWEQTMNDVASALASLTSSENAR